MSIELVNKIGCCVCGNEDLDGTMIWDKPDHNVVCFECGVLISEHILSNVSELMVKDEISLAKEE